MHELRILSGLHRGATLPLDANAHAIGASEEADVVLVDSGIEQLHATLSPEGSAWLLSANEGQIFNAQSNRPQQTVELAPGGFARVGDIWLTISEEGAPWEKPPAQPPHEPEAEPVETEDEQPEFEADENGLSGSEEEAPHDAEEEFFGPMPENPPQALPSAGVLAAAPQDAPRRWRKARLPLLIVAALSIAGFYALWASYSKRPQPLPAKPANTLAQTAPKAAAPKPDAKPEAAVSEDELRTAFRKRLADAELLRRFDLNLEDHNWTMRATLDADEMARFDRILETFVDKYSITFPVSATVGNGEIMLPFKVRQVISGANASIVTDDGHRLYVGEQYRGVRLVAVRDTRLTFAGKRKIEVNW